MQQTGAFRRKVIAEIESIVVLESVDERACVQVADGTQPDSVHA
jgi:hypothetical protein